MKNLKNSFLSLVLPIIIGFLIFIGFFLLIFFELNILIIIFDFIIKGINLLSGVQLFSSVLNNSFSPSSPAFIVYLIISIITFLIAIFMVIRVSFKSIYNQGDFLKLRNSFNLFSRFRFLLYWFLGIFSIPIVMFLAIYGVNVVVGLFGFNTFLAYQSFSSNEINLYFNEINKQLISYEENIQNLIVELDDLWSKEVDINKKEIYLKQINFLKTFQEKINFFKGNLLTPIHGNFNSVLLRAKEIEIWYKDDYLILLDKINLTEIKENNLSLGNLEILFDKFNLTKREFSSLLYKDGIKLNTNPDYISIKNIIANNSENSYKYERITQQLNITLFDDHSVAPLTSFPNIFQYGLPILYIFNVFTNIFNNTFFNKMIAFFGLGLALLSFFNIIIIVASRLFDLIALIIVAPFYLAKGINDDGASFEIWYKSIIGKLLFIVFISISIQIWAITIGVLPLIDDAVIESYKLDKNNIPYMYFLFSLFLKVISLIGLNIGLEKFIHFICETLNAGDNFKLKNQYKSMNNSYYKFMNETNQLSLIRSNKFQNDWRRKNDVKLSTISKSVNPAKTKLRNFTYSNKYKKIK